MSSSRRPHPGGRHELGQNLLVDRAAIARITSLVAATRGPIIELCAGDGAITAALSRLGRPVLAIEIHAALAARLERRRLPRVTVEVADVLHRPLPRTPHAVVGNLPFASTTRILRRLLVEPGWTDAVLIVQWEVARRRAQVGGATQLTAEWLPWFRFELNGRVPARAFRPVPGVDGGILTIRRLPDPVIADRAGYQRMVGRVFRAPGGRIERMARAATGIPGDRLAAWRTRHGLTASSLPRDLDRAAWVDLWALGRSPGRR